MKLPLMQVSMAYSPVVQDMPEAQIRINIGHMAAHLQMNRHTVDKWVRETVNEGLLARNIFTEFGELRPIVRLNWRRIRSLLEEQL